MKVLLINYRYFVSGGPERYMFNVKAALEECGHEVIPFSIQYSNNEETEYESYFVAPLDDSGSVYFDDHKPSLKTYAKTVERLFYARDVAESLSALIEKTKPDVAYVLHYLRKLSPSVLSALKKKEVPIVVRLSDYQMICPQSHCLRGNVPCELCVNGSSYSSVKYSCVKGSKVASLLEYLATKFHEISGYFDYVDKFVNTNSFAKDLMVKGGYDESRMVVIPTFVEANVQLNNRVIGGEYVAYIGRLDPTKGVDLLLHAFSKMVAEGAIANIQLMIIGEGSSAYTLELSAIPRQYQVSDQVQFLGKLEKSEVDIYLAGALFSVVPARSYDNLPNVILESFAAGTPIVVSDIGSLTELVEGGETGLLFEPGNVNDLSKKLAQLLCDRDLLDHMSLACIKTATEKYSKEEHLGKLLAVFQDVVRK